MLYLRSLNESATGIAQLSLHEEVPLKHLPFEQDEDDEE
jgi:hypothetical protein